MPWLLLGRIPIMVLALAAGFGMFNFGIPLMAASEADVMVKFRFGIRSFLDSRGCAVYLDGVYLAALTGPPLLLDFGYLHTVAILGSFVVNLGSILRQCSFRSAIWTYHYFHLLNLATHRVVWYSIVWVGLVVKFYLYVIAIASPENLWYNRTK